MTEGEQLWPHGLRSSRHQPVPAAVAGLSGLTVSLEVQLCLPTVWLPACQGTVGRCHSGNGDTVWEEGRSSCKAASADEAAPSPGKQGCPGGSTRMQRSRGLPGAEGDGRFVCARGASPSEDPALPALLRSARSVPPLREHGGTAARCRQPARSHPATVAEARRGLRPLQVCPIVPAATCARRLGYFQCLAVNNDGFLYH